MKKGLIKLLLVFALFLTLIFFGEIKSNNNIDYLDKLNLQLSGKVENLIFVNQGHDYGILEVSIYESSIEHYDEREKRKYHLGVIKRKKAEIIVSFISAFKKHDSIIINGSNFKIIRKNKIINEDIWDLPFYNFIQNPYKEINNRLKL